MKKSKRIICMFLAAVMLLGVVPAYAAAPLSPLAAILAIPVGGQLMNAGPVSSSISKAIAVSKPSEPAPAPAPTPEPAPAAQTTPSTSTGRLADGTTGATVGLVGKTADVTKTELKAVYSGHTGLRNIQSKEWLIVNDWKPIGKGGQNYSSGTVALIYSASNHSPKDLVGQLIPAGWLVDVYAQHDGNKYVFICQYDTRDGNPLTITVAPGNAPKKEVTPARTSFNDVNPGDWYYEAVTALANGNLIHTVFDTDPNGSFKPNELVKDGEIKFISQRLRGVETEYLVMETYQLEDYRASRTRYHAAHNILETRKRLQSPAITAQVALTDVDAMAIDAFADMCAKDTSRNFGWSYKNAYAKIRDDLRAAYALGIVRTPGTPETIDFDAHLTRAEYCVMLYRAGMTSFGCCP